MLIYVKKTEELKLPNKANISDAGYDVVAASDPRIVGEELGGGYWKYVDYIEYSTNLYVAPELDNVSLDLRPRSSISKYNLLLCNAPATVDNGYRGEIKVRFKYIWQPNDIGNFIDNKGVFSWLAFEINKEKIYQKGDKICQILGRYNSDIQWQIVDELESTARGTGGFGSSGV